MNNALKNLLFVVLFYGLITTAWVGCKPKELRPADILSKDEFTQVMMDIYLTEAKLTNFNLPVDSARKLFIPMEDSILKKHGISDSVLKKTYQYYFDHPTELDRIYDMVIDSLSLRERKASGSPTTVN